MPKPEKYFCEYRNEATDPFVQLYYDILSRFHVNDYNKALEGMSDKMRQIIMACNERLQSQSRLEQGASISQPQNNKQINHNMQNTEITQQDCEFVANRLNAINDRIFEICKLAVSNIRDYYCNCNVSVSGENVIVNYDFVVDGFDVYDCYSFPIDWLPKTDNELIGLIEQKMPQDAENKKASSKREVNFNVGDLPF